MQHTIKNVVTIFLFIIIVITTIVIFTSVVLYFNKDKEESEKIAEVEEGYEVPEYKIIEEDSMEKTKISFDVRIPLRYTKEELKLIAKEINEKNPGFEKTFITILLPGMDSGAGAWATAHTNPGLEIRILEFGNPSLMAEYGNPTSLDKGKAYKDLEQWNNLDFFVLSAISYASTEYTEDSSEENQNTMLEYTFSESKKATQKAICTEYKTLGIDDFYQDFKQGYTERAQTYKKETMMLELLPSQKDYKTFFDSACVTYS